MQLKKAIINMRERYGTTFFLTTHIIEDIDIADRIILLHKGNIVFDGPKEKLAKMFGDKKIIEIKFLPNSKINFDFGKILYKGFGVARIEIKSKLLKSKKFVDFLSNKNIIDYNITEPSLNEVLIKLYNKLS